jgi:hypothetical protein
MLNKIRNNCKKATFLIDKKNLEGINVIQQIELHIHLTGCSLCRLYDKQSRIMNDLIEQLKQNSLQKELKLNEYFKKALGENIVLQLKKM